MTADRPQGPDRNLPAPTPQTAVATSDVEPPAQRPWRQPLSVAFLPLAIVTLLVLAFAMALWTFLAATT